MTESVRPVVYLSAYACEPGSGSESGAGWVALRSASELASKIVLITRVTDTSALEHAVAQLACPVTVIRVPTMFDGTRSVYGRYISWLLKASWHVRRVTSQAGIFQHVSYASDWLPIPILMGFRSPQRVIWGPVGGATYPSLSLAWRISPRLALKEAVRAGITRLVRRLTHLIIGRRISHTILLNADSRNNALRRVERSIHPNCVLDYHSLPAIREPDEFTLVYVGRLIELKGIQLLIEAFKRLDPRWTLTVVGDGPEERRFDDLGPEYSSRITRTGWLPRSAALEFVARSTVMIFPSLHDSVGWAAAEAAALGVPVVCLDLGGVATVCEQKAIVVPTSPQRTLVARLAAAIEDSTRADRVPFTKWTSQSLTNAFSDAYGGAPSNC